MSLEMMVRVMTDAELTRPQQSVLFAMAENADDEGKSCRPSVDRIAWKAGYKTRAVEEIMRSLRAKKIIIQVAPARQHRAPEYEIHLENAPQKMPFEEWRKLHGKKKSDRRGAETAPLEDEDETGSGAHSHVSDDDSGAHSDVSEGSPGAHSRGSGAQFDGSGAHSHDSGAQWGAPEPSDEPSGKPSDEPLEDESPSEPGPTGGMFVRLFDEALEKVRDARPANRRSSLSGKWRKNLRRAADAELESGRDPDLLRQAVSRLAMRIDGYTGMELAEAINDVLDGKPFDESGSRRSVGRGRDRKSEVTRQPEKDYDWFFGGSEPDESDEPDEAELEAQRAREEAEREEALEHEKHLAFVRGEVRKWRRTHSEKDYGLRVFRLKNSAMAHGLTSNEVDEIDAAVRSENPDEGRKAV